MVWRNVFLNLLKCSAWLSLLKPNKIYQQFSSPLYRNSDVLGEMLDVLSFWMEKGCDGFRMDAVM